MSLRFQKCTEDFVCEHCGTFVSGNGFTNHCPQCLCSKHVDLYPGDRGEICSGLMQPRNLLLEKGAYIIVHECVRCHRRKRNRADSLDNLKVLLEA